MTDGYFHRVHRSFATRFWINNPTPAEARAAIAQGAVSCTSNPTYAARMLQVDRAAALAEIDRAIAETPDDARAADLVQQRLLKRIMAEFDALFDPARRDAGFVSVQGDPRKDTDAQHIISEVREHRHIARNYLAKIPATAAGLQAIEFCLVEDIPVIATEVFSLSQAFAVAELHRRTWLRTGRRTPLYLTHISGIFDDYLAAYAQKNGLDIPSDLLRQAGLIVAKEQYRLLAAGGYDGIVMLGGGARGPHHFSEIVGGTMHATINPNTADELVRMDQPALDRLHASAPPSVVATLCRQLPDLAVALTPGAQRVEDFEHYGPVLHFLSAFIKGWETLLEAVREQRGRR